MYLIKSGIFSFTFSAIGLIVFYNCISGGENKKIVKKLFFVLAACILISFASPSPIINIIASFFVVPVFAKKLQHIAPIYIFYFLNMPAISYQMNIGGIYLFDWYNYSSLTVGSLICCLANNKDRSSNSAISTISVLLIILMYFIIGVRGTSLTNAVRVAVDLTCSILLPFSLMRKSIKSIDNLRKFLMGVAAATASLSSLAIYEARVGWPIYTSLSAHYGLDIGGGNSVKIRGGVLRSAGPFPEPTSFALWLALGTFIVIVSRWMFKSNFHRLLSICLCCYGLISPQSRGALFGLVCAFLFYKFLSSNTIKFLQGVVVSFIGALALYIAGLTIPSIGSMLGLNSSGTLNRDYRQDLFSRGMEEAYKHPFIGQSLPDVMNSLVDLKQGEGIIDFVNTYLFILLTTGFIGLIIFIFAIVSNIIMLLTINGAYKNNKLDFVAVVAAMIFSVSMMIIFTSLGGRTTAGLSMFIAIGGCLYSVKNKNIANTGMSTRIPKRNLIEDSKLEYEKRKGLM